MKVGKPLARLLELERNAMVRQSAFYLPTLPQVAALFHSERSQFVSRRRFFDASCRRVMRLFSKGGFPSEDMMVVLGETVRLVADVLQQAEREGVAGKFERVGLAGAVDLFLTLGE